MQPTQEKAERRILKPSHGRLIQTLVPWVIGLAFVAVEIRRVSGQIAIRYPDFFGWAERAMRLNFRNITDPNWVHGLYPLGYPVLLRLGVELGADVLSTAFALSIIGGFLGLMGTFFLIRRMTHNWTLAVLTQFALGCMAYYLFFANLDATDMLAAGLQICSLALLLGEQHQRREAFIAGLLVGLSYLIRYTASLTVMPSALFLISPFLLRRDKESLVLTALYLGGALLGGSPQFITSLLIKGTPLYNEQAHNLWFHLQDSADYIRKWREVPMDISMWDVIAPDPWGFVKHWWEIFKSYWLTGDGYSVDGILGLFPHAGLWFALIATGELRKRGKTFLALYTAGFVAMLSLTRLDRRFLITLMPLQVFGSLYFLWHLLPPQTQVKGRTLPIRIPILLLIMATYPAYPLNFMRSNPFDTEIVEVSNTLHSAGMRVPSDVLTTHTEYHDVSSPWKLRYDMAAFLASDLSTYDEVRAFLDTRGYRFFIFDQITGLFLYPDMEFALHPENRPAGLTPIYVPEERKSVIYRVEGPQWPTPAPVNVTFAASGQDEGIELMGYTLVQSDCLPPDDHQRLGIYLHWTTHKPVANLYKVFVHLMDNNGQLVAQHDGLHALWTYPINQWKVGETVVDFHPLIIPPEVSTTLVDTPLTLNVGLYDMGTGERLAAWNENADSLGDHITLTTDIVLHPTP